MTHEHREEFEDDEVADDFMVDDHTAGNCGGAPRCPICELHEQMARDAQAVVGRSRARVVPRPARLDAPLFHELRDEDDR